MAAVGIVAGSGIDLVPLLTRVDRTLPFADCPGLAAAGVAGHAGAFVVGRCDDIPVVLQCGRLHLYEGLDLRDVVRPAEILAELGASSVVFTNAAGGLLPGTAPGDLLAVDRVLTWPCLRWPRQPAAIGVDTVLPGCSHRGPYIWVHGPGYETRAEIRALRRLGGAAVGMSTAPELDHARRLGLRAAVVSCITNSCLTPQVLTHEHVLATARDASERLRRLLRATLPALAG